MSPDYTHPNRHPHRALHVLLMYKNFGAIAGISHIGLGVASLNNAKVLNRIGIKAQVIPIKAEDDIKLALGQNPDATHVVISAPWVSTKTLSYLCAIHPDVQFSVVSHSNVGFLQADSNGIRLIKEGIQLEGSTSNFHIGGNSQRFCSWVENAFGEPATYLPNMYYLHHRHGEQKRLWRDVGGTLRIGIFGAARSLKNMLSSVGAAMEMSYDLGAQTEIWINCGRDDGPESKRIRAAAAELVAGMPNVTLKELNWTAWPTFKRQVGTMHVLLQPSYTESFNMVTADGISEGVASVVSDSITWAPPTWKAEVDDVGDIARVGMGILNDPEAAKKGLEALKKHNRDGERAWVDFLVNNRFGNPL